MRYNIIPDNATLSGTLRTFDTAQRDALALPDVRRLVLVVRPVRVVGPSPPEDHAPEPAGRPEVLACSASLSAMP